VIRGGEVRDSAGGGALVWEASAGVEFDGVQAAERDLTFAKRGPNCACGPETAIWVAGQHCVTVDDGRELCF